jgi:hypothetical protein
LTEPLEVEALPVKQGEIIPMPAPQSMNLFGVRNPQEILQKAEEHAKVLAGAIEKRALYTEIKQRRHVWVEGWTLLGSMLGVFPVCVWTRPLKHEDGTHWGWEARVEARTLGGALVGAAEAQCLCEEQNWAGRDDYALRSMAQTRATSKALRLPLGFVVTLAGFDSTPAEEMSETPDTRWPGEPVAQEPGLEQPLQASIKKAQAAKPNAHYNEAETCKCGSPEKWKTIQKDGVSKGYWFCELADLANHEWKIKKGKAITAKEKWALEQVNELAAEGVCGINDHTKFKEKK